MTVNAPESTGGKDVDADVVSDVTCGGNGSRTASVPGNHRSQVAHAHFDHVIALGNLLELIGGESDVHDAVENGDGCRYRAPRTHGVFNLTGHGEIRWPGEAVTDNRRLQRNHRSPLGKCGCDFGVEFDPLMGHGSTLPGTGLNGSWQDDGMAPVAQADQLRSDVQRTGYYPELVCDALETALAGEQVKSYMVHHEATFDRDQLRRHMTVLALTPTRLIVQHTDEHQGEESNPAPFASASTEAVRLEKVDSVVVTRVVSEPAAHTPGGAASEVVLTIGWGAVNRIDLEPATCGDPQCEADHGFTGTSSNDDFSVRVSAVADGPDIVRQALAFAAALSEATASSLR